jgi:hypothetical protein
MKIPAVVRDRPATVAPVTDGTSIKSTGSARARRLMDAISAICSTGSQPSGAQPPSADRPVPECYSRDWVSSCARFMTEGANP